MSPTFNFSTGNPNNLTAGANAAMSDIQGSLTDLRSALNGNLDEVNVPNLAAAFTSYKVIGPSWGAALNTAAAAALYGFGPTVLTNIPVGGQTATGGFFIDPTFWAANARTTKYRLRVSVVVNGQTATGVTFTPSLLRVTAIGGAPGAAPSITSGNTVTGSNAGSLTAPAAQTASIIDSGDFNPDIAGLYCYAVTTNAALPANCNVTLTAQLLMRQA